MYFATLKSMKNTIKPRLKSADRFGLLLLRHKVYSSNPVRERRELLLNCGIFVNKEKEKSCVMRKFFKMPRILPGTLQFSESQASRSFGFFAGYPVWTTGNVSYSERHLNVKIYGLGNALERP